MKQSLKQKILAEKSTKHHSMALKFLAKEGGVKIVFANNSAQPSPQQFADMCVASKYGQGDPLFKGGDAFALEYIVKGLNDAITDYKTDGSKVTGRDTYTADSINLNIPKGIHITTDEGVCDEEKFHTYLSVSPHYWGNILSVYVFNKTLLQYLEEFNTLDFEFNSSSGLYVETGSGQIGMRIFVESLLPLTHYPFRPEDGHGPRPHALKSNEVFTQYTVQVGLVEDFDALDSEMSKHDVKMHERHLATGKVVPVKGHERKNPTYRMSRKANIDEVSHVVYQAYDLHESLRYVGEGRQNRPQHVNSGASHNFKLNEHFFLNGPMRVDIVANELSKSEALAIEYLLIKKHSGCGLWNIKDYEPVTDQDT